MIISKIKYTQLVEKLRFDAEYYKPNYLQVEESLKKSAAVPLSELIDFSLLRKNPQEEPEKGFKYIDISNVDTATGKINVQTLRGYEAPSRARKLVEKNDIIISTVRPNRNAVAIIPKELDNQICSTGFSILKARKINPFYLFGFLKSRYAISQLTRMTMASMYPAVSEDDIGTILVPVPPSDYQEKIQLALIEFIKDRELAIKKYEEAEIFLTQALNLKSIKPDGFINTYNIMFNEIEDRLDAEYYKPIFMQMIRSLKSCAEYDVIELGELVDVIKYGTSEDIDYKEKGIPFLRLNELDEMATFDLDMIKRIRKSDASRLKAYSVIEGDLLISRTGTVGRSIYIDKYLSHSIFGSYFIRIKLKPSLSPRYISFFLNSSFGQLQSEQKKTGGVQTNLTIPAILSLKIAIPDKEKQNQICGKFDDAISVFKDSKENLKQLKKQIEDYIETNF